MLGGFLFRVFARSVHRHYIISVIKSTSDLIYLSKGRLPITGHVFPEFLSRCKKVLKSCNPRTLCL